MICNIVLSLRARLLGEDFFLMEMINYYKHDNSDVCVLLLDASQAVLKVNYIKFFSLPMKININPLVIRCLLNVKSSLLKINITVLDGIG